MSPTRVDLFVPAARLERWVANFLSRHGAMTMNVADGALVGFAQDRSYFEARLPFGRPYDGPAGIADMRAAAAPPDDWGLLLVRKGGFAVLRMTGAKPTAQKIGRRHVQGRSKAGGWSQQRFARRRENQASAAYAAASDHAVTLLGGCPMIVTGGDRAGLDEVLAQAGLASAVVAHLPDVAEPRRGVVDIAVQDALSVRMSVTNS